MGLKGICEAGLRRALLIGNRVIINGSKSDWGAVTSGVSQWYVLGQKKKFFL